MNYKDLIPKDAPIWVKDRVILMAISGSHSYGTNVASSDMDYKGVCIPPDSYYLGLDTFSQYNTTGGKNYKNTKDDVDIVINHINKFVMDAMSGVPNNIELLFLDPKHILYVNEYGNELISHRHDFMSKAIKHKMSGYAYAQRKRMLNNGTGAGRQELIDEYGYDTKFAMHGIRLLTSCVEILETGSFNTYRPNRELLLDIRNGKFSLMEVVELMSELDSKIERLYKTTDLPHTPDYNKINKWLIELNKNAMGTI